jgi:N-acetylglucosaminyldiphosphoundecaprenol N-acetyl-beta-D-mannosaminyltransferase
MMMQVSQAAPWLDILGCRVHRVDMPTTLEIINQFILERRPRHVITLNAEIIYTALQNPELQQVINQADLVTPDGAGVVWAARFLGCPLQERVTGIDLMVALSRMAAEEGWRVFLLGARPGVAGKAANNLETSFPGLQVVGTQHGYFAEYETDAILTAIREKQPDLLFVALGAPYQEFWIRRYLIDCKVPVAVGVGGSLDVLAGEVARAPEIFIRLNLEWLYRLFQEPKRWRRQLALPRFVFQVFRQKYRSS